MYIVRNSWKKAADKLEIWQIVEALCHTKRAFYTIGEVYTSVSKYIVVESCKAVFSSAIEVSQRKSFNNLIIPTGFPSRLLFLTPSGLFQSAMVVVRKE